MAWNSGLSLAPSSRHAGGLLTIDTAEALAEPGSWIRSFGLMHELKVGDALTTDQYFHQAGFNPLLGKPV